MKTAIIIIVFNISNLISTQIKLINKFCKDIEFDIIVIDNSNKIEISSIIEKHTTDNGCQYIKTPEAPCDFSQSHAFACNFAYSLLKNKYDYVFFLDHDNFPIGNFSVSEILTNEIIAGIGQSCISKNYFWPGCVMINNKINSNLVDFSVNPNLGLDTGGNLYKIIDVYGIHNCIFFDQIDIKNTLFDGKSYNNYNIITAPISMAQQITFMHFINASNWNKIICNEDRINSLLKILDEYVNIKGFIRG